MDDVPAKVSTKGQVTVPKPIRDALELAGQEVVFRLDGPRVVFASKQDDLDVPQAPAPPQTAPRLPWDAARRSNLHHRAGIRRRVPSRMRPDPAIVVDLRSHVGTPTRTP